MLTLESKESFTVQATKIAYVADVQIVKINGAGLSSGNLLSDFNRKVIDPPSSSEICVKKSDWILMLWKTELNIEW